MTCFLPVAFCSALFSSSHSYVRAHFSFSLSLSLSLSRNVQSPIGTGLRLRIRRDFLFEDAVNEFTRVVRRPLHDGGFIEDGSRLKERLQIEFQGEAGIDGGGLFKEFIDNLTKLAFDPCYGLFQATDGAGSERLLSPSPSSGLVAVDHLERFRFLGRVLGKSLYEGVLVEPRFATFFLNKLLGRHNLADELGSLDAELYRSLIALKTIDGDEEMWEELALSFDVTVDDFGAHRIVELFPGGSRVAVTAANRDRYVAFTARYYLEVQTKAQTDGACSVCTHCQADCSSLSVLTRPPPPNFTAFLSGLRELIPESWLRLFSPSELQLLSGGSTSPLDVVDFKRHVRLVGGYDAGHRVVRWFFEIVNELTPDQCSQLLMFATACSRPPLLGFQHLHPPFTLQRVNITNDSARLPTAATCMNLLKLPTYSSKDVLRAKLLLILPENQGFELT